MSCMLFQCYVIVKKHFEIHLFQGKVFSANKFLFYKKCALSRQNLFMKHYESTAV